MVHLAAGYARQRNRLGTFACTSSVGPGATNMVTGAALATINRLPVLLLPGDTFATRTPHPVLQQLEAPHDAQPVGQRLPAAGVALLRARRAPRAARARRAGGDARPHRPGRDGRRHAGAARGRADRGLRGARGVPGAAHVDGLPPAAGARGAGARRRSRARRAAPADRRRRRRHLQRGHGRAARAGRRDRHPGGRDAGRPRRAALRASALARRGRAPPAPRRPTGWPAMPTSSSAWGRAGATSPPPRSRPSRIPGVRFVNVNVAAFDAAKHSGLPLVADARVALDALREALAGWRADEGWGTRAVDEARAFGKEVARVVAPREGAMLHQAAVIGADQRRGGGDRRRRVRRGLGARRPAQALARARSRRARATTSSTATRAWATRSRAAWGSSSPRPSATSSSSSATARI